jgi:hypothetical protein
MGCNGGAYKMMKHEMKGVSSTRYETNQSYHDKSKKINIKTNKIMQDRPKDLSIIQGLNKTYNSHGLTHL